MPSTYRVASTTDIPDGEGRCVEIEGRRIAVFHVNGNYMAIDDSCPHRGGPLSDGPIRGTTVTCPWHGWQFDGVTGACSFNPEMSVTHYQATVEGDSVFLEV